MKLYEVVNFYEFYKTYLATESVNVKTAYKISRILNKTKDDYEFYQENIKKLFNEYLELNEDGTPVVAEDGINWKTKEGKTEEFMEKVNELYNIEVDFADEYKLSIDDFDGLVVSMDNFKDIIEDANTISLFADKKAIIVNNSYLFTGKIR